MNGMEFVVLKQTNILKLCSSVSFRRICKLSLSGGIKTSESPGIVNLQLTVFRHYVASSDLAVYTMEV